MPARAVWGTVWVNAAAVLPVAAVSPMSVDFCLHVAKAASIKRTGPSEHA